MSVLTKVNSYVIWIDDPGFSISINHWRDTGTGKDYFCWAELINYVDITKEPENTPFVNIEGHALFNMPGQIRGKTIEEVIENIEKDIQYVKDEKKHKIENETEARRLMRTYIRKDSKLGSEDDLELTVTEFNLLKLTITTKVENNTNWEHVFNKGRRILWRNINGDTWEALSKKKTGQGAQSLLYISKHAIILERDS